MAVYAIVIMVILAIIMTVFIILSILKEDSNNKKNQNNIIYPFNAKIQTRDTDDHEGSIKTSLLTSDGRDQIQCPAGTHINIIGSWTDIVDPNGTCSPTVGSTFKLSCGFIDDLSAAVKCQDTSDCAAGMECTGSQKCAPKPCRDNSGCSSTSACTADVGKLCGDRIFASTEGLMCIDNIIHRDPSAGQCLYCRKELVNGALSGNGYCAQSPTCANLTTNADNAVTEGQNKTCTKHGCVPRDSSAYLASICDGRRTCKMPGTGSTLMYDPSESSIFGPNPCGSYNTPGGDDKFAYPVTVADWWPKPYDSDSVSDYETLPIAPGWDGSIPGSGQNVGGISQASTYSLGYYVHGIFQCQPD